MLREDNAASPTAEKSVGEADLALDKTFKSFFSTACLFHAKI